MSSHSVIIVSFLQDYERDFLFTNWPNHITIVPYFKADNLQELFENIQIVCSENKPLSYTIGDKDYFGPNNKVEVSKLAANERIIYLHKSLLNIALKSDPNMELKYSMENFKPHITHNEEPHPEKNKQSILRKLYLVENLSPEKENKIEQNKKILAVFSL